MLAALALVANGENGVRWTGTIIFGAYDTQRAGVAVILIFFVGGRPNV